MALVLKTTRIGKSAKPCFANFVFSVFNLSNDIEKAFVFKNRSNIDVIADTILPIVIQCTGYTKIFRVLMIMDLTWQRKT